MRILKVVRFLTAFIVCSLAVNAQSQQSQVVAGEYLIKFKISGLSASDVSQKMQGKANLKASFKSLNIYHIAFKSAAEEQQNLNDLRQDPDVEFIEPNYKLKKTDTASDTSTTDAVRTFSRSDIEQMAAAAKDVSALSSSYSQSGAPVQANASWAAASPTASKPKVIVAIVDTGLDKSDTVFKPYSLSGGANIGGTGALWTNTIEANGTVGVDDDSNGFVDDINGWNFIVNTNNFYDDDNHGTHVAGIIVGAGLDIRATPLDESKILVMPLKFLDNTGAGSTANAIRAIYYAVDNGAKVINNSWGGSSYSRSLHEALTYAYTKGVVIVTAAGNYSKSNDTNSMYPANYPIPSLISVAATTDTDDLAYFSNFGAASVHIGAPGVNITSTLPGNYYGMLSGTSMAAPFISGMAALAVREAPNLTGYQIKTMMLSQADNAPSLLNRTTTSGRVNSLKTIQGAQGMVSAASYQPAYSPDYQSMDMASSSSASSSKGGGCGLVSSAIMGKAGAGGGPGNPLGVLAGLLMLPVLVWFALRKRSTAPESKRRYERFKMNSEVKVCIGDRELVGSMNSISMGGLSFNVDEALEKGGVVTMRIAGPDGHESIEVTGQIVWSEKNQSYGVAFEKAHEGAKAMIKHWSQSLAKT